MKHYKVEHYDMLLPGQTKWQRFRPKIRWGLIFSAVFMVLRAFTF